MATIEINDCWDVERLQVGLMLADIGTATNATAQMAAIALLMKGEPCYHYSGV